MPDYKEVQTTGRKWQRCNFVTIDNSQGKQPYVVFGEESAVELDGVVYVQPNGSCRADFDQVAGVIEMRDPATGELTGETVTHDHLYRVLYSLYLSTALKRDEVVV